MSPEAIANLILGGLGLLLVITGACWKSSVGAREHHFDTGTNEWIQSPALPDWYAKNANWPMVLGAICLAPVLLKLFKIAVLGE
jgi:hypothetical protein